MVITELDVGGAEQAFVRIAQGLQSLGWSVCVVSLRDKGPLAAVLEQAGIPVTALGCGGFADVRAVFRLGKFLKQQPADALLTFLHQANIVGRLAGRMVGLRRIISGIRVADRRISVALPERLTARFVDHYVAVSRNVARVHRELCGIPVGKMSVIANGVDYLQIQLAQPVDRKEIGCSSDDWIILCAGRLTAQKAPFDLLQAFERFVNQRSASDKLCKLVFVGDGPLRRSLEARVAASGLQNRVVFLGWRSDMHGLMKSADVLVLASHWEGLPNVLLEAQAAGLPVIASDVDGCVELVEDGVTGRLFASGDTNALANSLDLFAASPELTADLSETARKAVQDRYSWEQCIAAFDSLLKNRCGEADRLKPYRLKNL